MENDLTLAALRMALADRTSGRGWCIIRTAVRNTPAMTTPIC